MSSASPDKPLFPIFGACSQARPPSSGSQHPTQSSGASATQTSSTAAGQVARRRTMASGTGVRNGAAAGPSTQAAQRVRTVSLAGRGKSAADAIDILSSDNDDNVHTPPATQSRTTDAPRRLIVTHSRTAVGHTRLHRPSLARPTQTTADTSDDDDIIIISPDQFRARASLSGVSGPNHARPRVARRLPPVLPTAPDAVAHVTVSQADGSSRQRSETSPTSRADSPVMPTASQAAGFDSGSAGVGALGHRVVRRSKTKTMARADGIAAGHDRVVAAHSASGRNGAGVDPSNRPASVGRVLSREPPALQERSQVSEGAAGSARPSKSVAATSPRSTTPRPSPPPGLSPVNTKVSTTHVHAQRPRSTTSATADTSTASSGSGHRLVRSSQTSQRIVTSSPRPPTHSPIRTAEPGSAQAHSQARTGSLAQTHLQGATDSRRMAVRTPTSIFGFGYMSKEERRQALAGSGSKARATPDSTPGPSPSKRSRIDPATPTSLQPGPAQSTSGASSRVEAVQMQAPGHRLDQDESVALSSKTLSSRLARLHPSTSSIDSAAHRSQQNLAITTPKSSTGYSSLHRTQSNHSTGSTSSYASSALSQTRKERLEAARESGRKHQEKQTPLSAVDVRNSPSVKRKRLQEDKARVKHEKRGRSSASSLAGSVSGAESSGSGARVRAGAARTEGEATSPLKRAIQPSLSVSPTRENKSREEDVAPVVGPSPISPTKGINDPQSEAEDAGVQGEAPAPEMADDSDEDLLALYAAEYAHIQLPPTPPPEPRKDSSPAPAQQPSSAPKITVDSSSLPVAALSKVSPSTPSRRPARPDTSKTHGALGAISPTAARFERHKRHATLSPTTSLSQLPRHRRLSSSRTHNSSASIDSTRSWLLSRRVDVVASLPSQKQAPKKRTAADILREHQEADERARLAREEEMREQESRSNATQDDTQEDAAPGKIDRTSNEEASGSMGRRKSSRLRGMPSTQSVAVTASTELGGDASDSDEASAESDDADNRPDYYYSPHDGIAAPTLSDALISSANMPAQTVAGVDAEEPHVQTDSAMTGHPVTEGRGMDTLVGLLETNQDTSADVDALREIAQGAEVVDEQWAGLWQKAEWTPVDALPPIKPPSDVVDCEWLEPLLQMAESGDTTPLLTMLITGACAEVLDCNEGVGPCEMLQYVIDLTLFGGLDAIFAVSTALSMIESAKTNPFGSSRGLLGKISYSLTLLGLAEEMQPLFPAHQCPDDACDAGCGWRMRDRNDGLGVMAMIVAKCAEYGWLEVEHAVQIARLFLFIAIEPYTSADLEQKLKDVLTILWPLCLEHIETAPGLAIFICEHASELPLLAQRRILFTVGSSSTQQPEIARWFGMELLLPGCLELLAPNKVHIVPSLQWVLTGTEAMLDNVVDPEIPTDHSLLATQIDALSAALNDIQQLIMLQPDKRTRVEERINSVIMQLRQAFGGIPRAISSATMAINNKMRLGQLSSIIEIQMAKPLQERERAQKRKRLKQGLILGDGRGSDKDQTRLNFAKVDKKAPGGGDAGRKGSGGGEEQGIRQTDAAAAEDAVLSVGTQTAEATGNGRATPQSGEADEALVPELVDNKNQISSLPPSELDEGGSERSLAESPNLTDAQPRPMPQTPHNEVDDPSIIRPNTDGQSAPSSPGVDHFLTPAATMSPSSGSLFTPTKSVLLRSAADETFRSTAPSNTSTAQQRGSPSPPNASEAPSPTRYRSSSTSLGARVSDAARFVARKAGLGGLFSPEDGDQSIAALRGKPIAPIAVPTPPLGVPSDSFSPIFGSDISPGQNSAPADALRFGIGPGA